MVGWLNRKSEKARPDATEAKPPWHGEDLVAESVAVPVGRRGDRTVPGVSLSAGETRVLVRADELSRFAEGKLDIVESVDEPLAFLARARSAAPDSVAAEQLRGLPPDAVALLVADPTTPPMVVLSGDALAEFVAWAR